MDDGMGNQVPPRCHEADAEAGEGSRAAIAKVGFSYAPQEHLDSYFPSSA
jgi:hypothetical protein